jgi:hypothetical protein
MSDREDSEGHTRKTFSEVLGALGPGGTASMRFVDYENIFGKHPTEDEIEGQRAAQFAKDHGCDHTVDNAEKRVLFRKI